MLIIGAGGLAKEVLEIFDRSINDNFLFLDNLTTDLNKKLFGKYEIIHNDNQVTEYFKKSTKKFVNAVGNQFKRSELNINLITLGGKNVSAISNKANIGTLDVKIEDGVIIMSGANISNDVEIKAGTLIYYNCNITHGCRLGNYVQLAPAVNLLGNVKIGDFTNIGANATILPNITIGCNSIIGAGSVVTKDVPDYSKALGVPAIIKSIL